MNRTVGRTTLSSVSMFTRRFLGSGTHLLHALAGDLVGRVRSGDTVDLSQHILVLPTSRARRRFETLLLEEVGIAQLTPPEILTPARLLDRFIVPLVPVASDMASSFAWLHAASTLDEEDRLSLLGHGDELVVNEQDELATRLSRLARELAAANLLPQDVPDRCEQLNLPLDIDAWAAIITTHTTMLAELERMGLADRDAAHGRALKDGRLHASGIHHITVVAADLQPRPERCLELLAESGIEVTAIVHGDEKSWADTCSQHGVVDVEHWSTCPLPIQDNHIVSCPAVDDQIGAALDLLADLGAIDATNARVVAPDDNLRRVFLAAAGSEGVAVDCFEGESASLGSVGTLLAMLASVANKQTAASVGELIRHPIIESWLVRSGTANPIALWDTCWARHAPHGLEAMAGVAEQTCEQEMLAKLVVLTQRLAGEAPADQWATRVMDLLVDLLDTVDLDTASESTIELVHTCLIELHELSPDARSLTAFAVIHLLLGRLSTQSIHASDPTGGVEVIGWLDTHLDDADNIIVMGMNEGIVPSSPGIDPWLPEQHREALQLDSRKRRVARDAFLLTATIESGRTVWLTSAQTTNTGEPLAPSGLLVRVSGAPLAVRMLRFVGEDGGEHLPTLAARRTVCSDASEFDAWPLPAGTPKIQSISVTSFRSFLKDPYAFLLERDGRIKSTKIETHFELDAMQFGTLAHDVVESWGRAEREVSTPTTDPKTIEQDLHAALDGFVESRFGAHPLPVVRLQAEMVRHRLSVFALHQAARAAAGWRVHSIEWNFGMHQSADHQAPRFPDDNGLFLTGKIDRVDLHDEYGYQALDYKTGRKADGAVKSHRTRNGWFNLQLPLYRVLLGSIGIDVPSSGLGYILLPPTDAKCGFDIASKWTDKDMAEAEATAAEVIEVITSGRLLELAADSCQ